MNDALFEKRKAAALRLRECIRDKGYTKVSSAKRADVSRQVLDELLDFFDMSKQSPSSSAFFQQREKLKPEAFKTVFDNFSEAVSSFSENHTVYRLIAADGSTTVVPFATSGSSGMGDSSKNLQELAKGAKVVEGKRFGSSASADELKSWAQE